MVKINPENIKVEMGLFFVVDAFPETNASPIPIKDTDYLAVVCGGEVWEFERCIC
jgi:hypothetical protein